MGPVVTLYILGGCVAAAAGLFIVMLVVGALRAPQLPTIRALTPLPFGDARPSPSPRAPQRVMRLDLNTAITRPAYPERIARRLARVLLVLIATSVLASIVFVAYPPMLDPLCDDYDWFGANAAQLARTQARAANAAIVDLLH